MSDEHVDPDNPDFDKYHEGLDEEQGEEVVTASHERRVRKEGIDD